MVGVKLPGEDQLPVGPQRALVLALHDLYQGAGRPSLRAISQEIASNSQYRDMVSHEAVGAMLRGKGVPRWSKLECLVHLLAVKHHPRLDPEDQVNRFLGLWNALSFPSAPQQPDLLGETIAFDPEKANHAYGDTSQLSYGLIPQPKNLPVPIIWGEVPLSNIKFTGRANLLAEIDSRFTLEPDDGGAKPLALYGIFGVGKTQVAIEYAHRYRSNYEVVWWVAADQLSEVYSSLAVLAVRLGVVKPPPGDGVENAARMALEALRRGEPFRNWLLIFDNASYSEDVLSYLPRGTGSTLITSRNPRWREVDSIRVSPFTRAESTEFLRKAGYGALREREAEQLAEQLGDLPLALAQSADAIATTGISSAQYRQILFSQPRALLNENKPSHYFGSMTAAWVVAIEAMEEIEPEALELLRVFSFFGPCPIPLEIIRERSLINKATVPTTSLGKVFADPITQGRAIRAISEFGLADIDSANSTIQVQILVQLLIREMLAADSGSEEFRHHAHVLLARAGPADPRNKDAWLRFASLAEHLGQCSIEDCRDPSVREFALHMAEFLHLSGDTASSLALTELLIERWVASSEILDPEPPEVVTVRRLHQEILETIGFASQLKKRSGLSFNYLWRGSFATSLASA